MGRAHRKLHDAFTHAIGIRRGLTPHQAPFSTAPEGFGINIFGDQHDRLRRMKLLQAMIGLDWHIAEDVIQEPELYISFAEKDEALAQATRDLDYLTAKGFCWQNKNKQEQKIYITKHLEDWNKEALKAFDEWRAGAFQRGEIS